MNVILEERCDVFYLFEAVLLIFSRPLCMRIGFIRYALEIVANDLICGLQTIVYHTGDGAVCKPFTDKLVELLANEHNLITVVLEKVVFDSTAPFVEIYQLVC